MKLGIEENGVVVEEVEEIEEAVEIKPELDDDDNPIEEETPLWMQDEEEVADQTAAETVPLSALMKQKGKGKVKDARIEELERENAALKQTPNPQTQLKRPRAADYNTDDEHEEALEAYDQQRDDLRRQQSTATKAQASRIQERETAVDSFIERAEAVVVKHKIKPETYKGALDIVQGIVEKAFPNTKDAHLEFLSRLEEGDETTLYMIGRNKSQRDKLEELFNDDPSGIKAFRHIARLTERNLGAKTKTSKAPKPAASASGNANAVPANERAWRKKYDKASGQERYDIKQKARAEGVKL